VGVSMKGYEKYSKGKGLCPISFGLAIGVTCAIFMMLGAWIAAFWGYGTELIDQRALMYHGYTATFVGGLVGGLWGLVKGFIFGALIAFFYNCISACKSKCCKCDDTDSQDRK